MSCPFGFDPFASEPDADFGEHVATCLYCSEVASIALATKRTWSASKERDDLAVAPFREQRLLRGRARSSRRASWAGSAVAFGFGVLVALFVLQGIDRRKDAASLVSAAPNASAMASVAPRTSAAPSAEAPVSAPPIARSLLVVAHRAVSLVGANPPTDAPIEVPRGGHLSLGFALDAASLDIEGPASIRRSVGSDVTLERGAAELNGSDALVVGTALARIHADHAACRIVVTESETRIEHRSGTVVVEAMSGGRESTTVSTPSIVIVGPDGAVWTGTREEERARHALRAQVEVRAVASSAPPSESAWTIAVGHLERGERADAESAFRAIAHDPAADARLRSRAAFRAGELALGRHDRTTGARELSPLLSDGDPALASDAALLLARTAATNEERAAIWDRLLARDLPDAYRAHALRERAAIAAH